MSRVGRCRVRMNQSSTRRRDSLCMIRRGKDKQGYGDIFTRRLGEESHLVWVVMTMVPDDATGGSQDCQWRQR